MRIRGRFPLLFPRPSTIKVCLDCPNESRANAPLAPIMRENVGRYAKRAGRLEEEEEERKECGSHRVNEATPALSFRDS